MTDIQRAMLGDHEAAARLTEQGVLLPCPHCGNPSPTRGPCWVYCEQCLTYGPLSKPCYKRTQEWNTRAPLLTPEQIERLERDSE